MLYVSIAGICVGFFSVVAYAKFSILFSLGANGTLDVEAPLNSENTNTLITKYDTGFSFVPVADEQERIWKCSLTNRNIKIATVNINVRERSVLPFGLVAIILYCYVLIRKQHI